MRVTLCVLAAITLSCGTGDTSPSLASSDGGAPSEGDSATTMMMTDGTAEQLCVDKINAYRKTLSLAPYARWSAAETCADGQAKGDSAGGGAHGAFGTCRENAQNECPGWPGPPSDMIPKCLAQMWGEGPGTDFSSHGHYLNMSSTTFTMVACGFYTLPSGSVWAVQDFK